MTSKNAFAGATHQISQKQVDTQDESRRWESGWDDVKVVQIASCAVEYLHSEIEKYQYVSFFLILNLQILDILVTSSFSLVIRDRMESLMMLPNLSVFSRASKTFHCATVT